MSSELLLREMYARFNAREIEPLLEAMAPDVQWPNGWEGGWVHGREGVRDYWTRQWAEIQPRVDPLQFETLPDERVRVRVAQTVRDFGDNVLFDGEVDHIYTIKNGLISKMEIET